MTGNRSLTERFREMLEWKWSDFVKVERDELASNFEAVLVSIIRACSKGDLRSIKTSLDRMDGKIAEEIQVEYPKFYLLYPNATEVADDPSSGAGSKKALPSAPDEVSPPPADGEPEELPTGSVRAVLERMLDAPKTIVPAILLAAETVDSGSTAKGNPSVKSVVVAGLMNLVHKGRMSAVFEVFNQIDGKVADKVKLLGEDVYMYRYDTVAPAGAVKNSDGVYQLAADNITDSWVLRLSKGEKR